MSSPSNYNPKPRTKTGCLMCRKRRKKCDELQPSCSACTRFGHRCVWPAPSFQPRYTKDADKKDKGTIANTSLIPPSSDALSPFSDDSTKIAMSRSAVYGLPGIRTSVEHRLALYFRQRFMFLLVRPNTHPIFLDTGLFFLLGCHFSVLTGAFLAATALEASRADAKLKVVATRFYNSVITGVRKTLMSGELTGDEPWLMTTTGFLCIFEEWNSGPRSAGQTTHLEGLAHILKIRISNSLKSPKQFVQPVDRVVTEYFVRNISTLPLYYSDIERIANIISWGELSHFLNPEVFPGASKFSTSPLLGSYWGVFRVMLEITRLSHKVPLNHVLHSQGQELELELYQLEEDVRTEIKDTTTDKHAQDSLQQTLLHIFAAQILAFKTLRLDTLATHPRIQSLVGDALVAVRALNITRECGPYLCWPLTILSCSVITEDNAKLLRQTLENIWLGSNYGDVQRVRNSAESLWKRATIFGGQEDVNVESKEEVNLLDVLVHPGGLYNHPYLK